MISTGLLDESAVTTGGVSKVLIMLPIGVTVAMGSVCILDTAPTIGETATVGNTCVLVPASTGCISAGIVFLTDVLSSPVCTTTCDRAVEGAAIPTAASWGSMTGPECVTEIICWAGKEQHKAGMCATLETRAAGEVVGSGGLGLTGKDGEGADNVDEECSSPSEMVDEHSCRAGIPAGNLFVGSAEQTVGGLVATVGTKAGTDPNLRRDETKVGVPTGGDANLPACVVSNLGRADTTFVLIGNTVEPVPGVSWIVVTSGVVARNDGLTAGVHSTKGLLTAGTLGSLTGVWGKTGAREATVTWLEPCGGTDAPVLVALAVGTC